MRVLVVAYYFPPTGGGGVNRTLRVVRGMSAAGWRPIVLTVDAAAWVQDPGLLALVPRSARVLRLPNPDWGRLAPAGPGAGRAAPAGGGRLRRWLVPDLHVGWSALAAPVAGALAATRAVDLVYTTCPPYSANAAGLAARAAGAPWVADFRDAWLDCPTRVGLPAWRRRLEQRMEETVLRRADRVLFASDAARARALARVPALRARCDTVLTGFDAADFAPTPEATPPRARLELVHAGSLLLNHMGDGLARFAALLARWCAREPAVRHSVRVCFVGAERGVSERLAQAGVGDFARVEAAVPRRALAARLRRAHVALAFSAPARFGGDPIPGKLFDAVGAGRFLLALAPPGGLADLVQRLALGAARDPADGDALIALLERLRRRALAGEPILGPPEASRAALANERAVASMLGAMRAARARPREERGRCPSPSAS